MKPTPLALPLYCLLMSMMGGIALAMPEAPPLHPYPRVVGVETVHAVEPGETIDRISRRFGVGTRQALAMNRLGEGARLKKGQRLTLSNRRIVPSLTDDGIVINIAERVLHWIQGGALMAQFPVGVGREAWETPVGHYEIVGRRRDPVWHVPPSIQREMLENGQEVKTVVPAGPGNPLGKYWLQLSANGIGIHGTNRPWTVGKYATHGCLRMRADDIEWLFYNVPTGTSVEIVDEPVKFARLDDGTLLMEAHPLRKKHTQTYTADRVVASLQAAGLADIVDSAALERAMRNAWGVAVDVTRRTSAPTISAAEKAAPVQPSGSAKAQKHQPNEAQNTLPDSEPAGAGANALHEPQAAVKAVPENIATTIAVETYRRPNNYIWTGGRPMRVGRP